DVRYISGLKRRLISVGQLDKEVYHVGFGDQQWKVTKGSLVVVHGNKRRSLYMVEDWWFGEAEESFLHNVSEDKETAETATGVTFCVENGIVMLKMVPETPLQFGDAERLSRTFRTESTRIRVEAPKMLWADSVSTTYLIYRIPYVPIGLRIPEEEWRGKDTSLAHLKVFGCDSFVRVKDVCGEAMKCTFIGLQQIESLVEFRNHLESKWEHRYEVSSKEGSSETPQVRRSNRESRARVRYPTSANYLLLIENGKPESYSEALSRRNASYSLWMFMVIEERDGSKRHKARLMVKGFQQKRGVDYNEIFSPVVKITTISWVKLIEILISEGSLSLLMILETKSFAKMFIRLVMKEKLKLCAVSTGL
ncbi:retrovirus-related pol polyprotein from transposon TNT 1-94, partial [Tanacetum coccineum]